MPRPHPLPDLQHLSAGTELQRRLVTGRPAHRLHAFLLRPAVATGPRRHLDDELERQQQATALQVGAVRILAVLGTSGPMIPLSRAKSNRRLAAAVAVAVIAPMLLSTSTASADPASGA